MIQLIFILIKPVNNSAPVFFIYSAFSFNLPPLCMSGNDHISPFPHRHMTVTSNWNAWALCRSMLTSLINSNSLKKKKKVAKNHPQLLWSKFSSGWDNRAFYLRLMSLQTKPPRETTHIWQSCPVCESQRTQWHGEQTIPSVRRWHWTPHASAVSPQAVNTGPLWATQSQTQDGRVGRVMCLLLSDSHTHTHVHTYAPAPTSLSDLTYTPRPENSFSACKCSSFHCNLWLWGQLCPSELPWASENRHRRQPHSLGCYF